MEDIKNKKDIKIFVDAFYDKVRKDDLLGAVFAARIKEGDWSRHLERMYSFWNTVLFANRDYSGNPFSKHANLPIQKNHFDRWLNLLKHTLDEHFEGEKTEEAKMRAYKMGILFQAKLEHIRANDNFTNIM